MSKWASEKLRDVLTLNYGKNLTKKNRIPGEVPVYGSNGIVGFHNSAIVESEGIIVGRKGSAGRVHFSPTPFCPIDTTFFVTPEEAKVDIRFLYFRLLELDLTRILGDVGVPGLNREMAYMEQVTFPTDKAEQQKIAYVLSVVQRAMEQQERLIQTTTELKIALMQKLFTEGTRGEPQKQTEIGPVPKSWEVKRIDSVAIVKSSSMSYSQLAKTDESPSGVDVQGVKVSDMNLPGNETEFQSASLVKRVEIPVAENRTTPADSIIFPKRGAAIATNKKRITTTWTVLDPNLIAVTPNESMNHRYLFHWFNTFDLAKVTDPGPTPQLNKKDIAPLKFPRPTKKVQDDIAKKIDVVEAKARMHGDKLNALSDLFKTLLHKLMTAEIRVNDIDLPGFEESS